MKTTLKTITAAFLALTLTLTASAGASAADNSVDPDTDTGTITITVRETDEDGGNTSANVDVTLYQVGSGRVENSNLYFDLVDPLAQAAGAQGLEIPLNGLTAEGNANSARQLEDLIDGLDSDTLAQIVSYESTTDENGTAVFSGDDPDTEAVEGLSVGVYLAVQTSRSSRYYSFDSFLIWLPMTSSDGTAWVYDIAAVPKVERRPNNPRPDHTPSPNPDNTPDPGHTPNPDNTPEPGASTSPEPGETGTPDNTPPVGPGPVEPTEPGSTGNPGGGSGETEIPEATPPQGDTPLLPQTGMLQWPVPVLALAGLLLLAIGWRRDSRKNRAQ